MADFLTFEDIYTRVANLIGDDDQSKIEQIKAVINQVYLNEVLQADELYAPHWLVKLGVKHLIAPATITAITVANPPVITCDAAHGLVDGDLVTIWGVVGMTEVNSFGDDNPGFDHQVYRVGTVGTTTVANDNFTLQSVDDADIDGSGFTAWTSGGTVLHQGWAFGTTIDKVLNVGIYNGLPLTQSSPRRILDDTLQFYSSSQSTPAEYYIRKHFTAAGAEFNDFEFGPGASQADQLMIYYQEKASRLTAKGNVPLLPSELHYALIAGAVTRLAENNVQVENAVIWPGIYSAELTAIVTANRRWWKQAEKDNPGMPYGLI